jgi:inorganic pyrophosphatase
MDFMELLEEEPLFELTRYKSGAPQNAVAFAGTLRKHPYDAEKCILLADRASSEPSSPQRPGAMAGAPPAGFTPAILEFRKADVIGVEELASPVDEEGHPRQVLRLWVRRGSLAIRYEPFEVDEPPRFLGGAKLREHVLSGTGART